MSLVTETGSSSGKAYLPPSLSTEKSPIVAKAQGIINEPRSQSGKWGNRAIQIVAVMALVGAGIALASLPLFFLHLTILALIVLGIGFGVFSTSVNILYWRGKKEAEAEGVVNS